MRERNLPKLIHLLKPSTSSVYQGTYIAIDRTFSSSHNSPSRRSESAFTHDLNINHSNGRKVSEVND